MGGAGVASVLDESAVAWNPGVLAQLGSFDGRNSVDASAPWRHPSSFSIEVAATPGIQAFNDVGQAVDELVQIGQTGGGSIGSVDEATRLVNGLIHEKWAASAEGNAGVFVHFGALGLGYLASTEISGIPRPSVPIDQIDPGKLDPDNLPVELVYEGLILNEVPLAYAVAPTPWLSVGVSVKYLYGQALAVRTPINQVDSSNYFRAIFDDLHGSSAFGLDAGVFLHDRWLEIGLLGRNLTKPSFGFGAAGRAAGIGSSVVLDPQLRLGFAAHAFDSLTVALDVDLLRNGAFLDDLLQRGYQVQNLSVGVEWLPFQVLALRLGMLDNLAESDLGPELTAGVGLALGPVDVDLAGQFALSGSELDSYSIPEELRLGLTIRLHTD